MKKEQSVQNLPLTSDSPSRQTSRIDCLDTAKGIGMLFVVFAHVNYTPSLQVLIYSFHMPLFFLLAGVVFDRSRYPTFRSFLAKKCTAMVIPYLIFSLLPLLGIFLMQHVLHISANFTPQRYLDSVIQTFLAQGSIYVFNTPLWFVPCLLVTESIYYFLSGCRKSCILPVCAGLTCLGWLLVSGLIWDADLYWSMDTALYALGFYAIGNLCAPFLKNILRSLSAHRKRTLLCILLFALCTALWLPLALRNGKISLGSRVPGNGFLLYLTGILGTAGILAVSILLEKNRFLRYLGRNSFCVMAVHCLVLYYILEQICKLAGIPLYDRNSVPESLLPFLFVLLVSLGITAAYNWIRSLLRK